MTPIAPHITAFLREHLPVQRGASEHTRESYAYAFQLLFRQQFPLCPNDPMRPMSQASLGTIG